MGFYLVENEYDLDLAVRECIKLMNIKHSRVKIGFNNMRMVKIFMQNLSSEVDEHDLNPNDMDFHVDVLVETEDEFKEIEGNDYE